jgi:hypothetical protein
MNLKLPSKNIKKNTRAERTQVTRFETFYVHETSDLITFTLMSLHKVSR